MRKNLIGLVAIVAFQYAGLFAMAKWRVMESILAPNPETSTPALIGALAFLLIRFTLYFIAPGAILAMLYWACIPAETPAKKA